MKILLLEPQNYSASARRILETLGQVTEGLMGRQALLDAIGEYDALIVRLGHCIDREVLGRAHRLKVIVTATTGLDHIDLKAAQERQISVLSLQGEREFLDTITATAEHAWGLLLALVRRMPAAHASVLEGLWDRDRFRGRELRGLTLGIVGYGRLGTMVARYGLAFGMHVVVFDPRIQAPEPPVRWAPLGEVLATAHCLSLHLPLNDQTVRMFGRREFDQMVRGSWLVNTSRGELIDEEALLEALESGHLGGAALDVLAGEQHPEKLSANPLLAYAKRHGNLILTPHIGGATTESMERTEVFMAEKLRQWACDHQPIRSKI